MFENLSIKDIKKRIKEMKAFAAPAKTMQTEYKLLFASIMVAAIQSNDL